MLGNVIVVRPPHPPAARPPMRDRLLGAALAFGISLIPVLIGASGDDRRILLFGGLLGLVVGPVLAYGSVDRVRGETAARSFTTALILAAKAVVVGDLVASVVLAGLGAANGSIGAVGAIPVLAIFGFVIFGLPSFALAVLVFWPWTFLVRAVLVHLARPGPSDPGVANQDRDVAA